MGSRKRAAACVTGRFTALTEDDVSAELAVSVASMSVGITVPSWKDLLCLDILVEAREETGGDDPLMLVFSSQWMDVPVAAAKPAGKAMFDGVHVVWREGSEDDLQPPASVYDGRHGMVTTMDLRLAHKAGATYRLVVSGATEFVPTFQIDTDVTLDGFTLMNDDKTVDQAVEDWFAEHFGDSGMTPVWCKGPSTCCDMYFYEGLPEQNTGAK